MKTKLKISISLVFIAIFAFVAYLYVSNNNLNNIENISNNALNVNLMSDNSKSDVLPKNSQEVYSTNSNYSSSLKSDKDEVIYLAKCMDVVVNEGNQKAVEKKQNINKANSDFQVSSTDDNDDLYYIIKYNPFENKNVLHISNSQVHGSDNYTGFMSEYEVPWYDKRFNINEVVIDDQINPKSVAVWFGCINDIVSGKIKASNITKFTGLDKISSDSFKGNASFMFIGCNRIDDDTLTLNSNLLNKVTNAKAMFTYSTFSTNTIQNFLSSLTNATDFSYSFFHTSLKKAELPKDAISSAKTLEAMFSNNENLEQVTNFPKSTNAENSAKMFFNCANLWDIQAEVETNWNKLENLNSEDMFNGCTKLPNYTKYSSLGQLDKKHANFSSIGDTDPGGFLVKQDAPKLYIEFDDSSHGNFCYSNGWNCNPITVNEQFVLGTVFALEKNEIGEYKITCNSQTLTQELRYKAGISINYESRYIGREFLIKTDDTEWAHLSPRFYVNKNTYIKISTCRLLDVTGYVKYANGNPACANVSFVSQEYSFNTTTDSDGKYTLSNMLEDVKGTIYIDCWYKERLYQQSIEYTGSEEAPPDVIITRQLDITGYVKYASGGVVTNADVELVSEEQTIKSKTDGNGKYIFESIEENSECTITTNCIYKEKSYEASTDYQCSDVGPADLVITRQLDIQGYVKYRNGDVVSGANIKLEYEDKTLETTTDDNGKYNFSDISEHSDCKITATCEYAEKPYVATIDYTCSEISPEDITIARLNDVSGYVKYANGDATNGAEVKFKPSSGGSVIQATTDENGKYTLSDVQELDTGKICVNCIYAERSYEQSIDYKNNETPPQDIVITRQFNIKGKVMYGNTNPCGGLGTCAGIYVDGVEWYMTVLNIGELYYDTGDKLLPENTICEIKTCVLIDWQPVWQSIDYTVGPKPPEDIIYSRIFNFHGNVKYMNGTPAGNSKVLYTAKDQAIEVKTDDNGYYSVDSALEYPDGKISVCCDYKGKAYDQSMSYIAGEQGPQDIIVQTLPDINGNVRFTNQCAVSDAKVKFVSGEQVFETTTDKDGKYVFYNVPENLEGKIIVDCEYLGKSYTESIDYTSSATPPDIVITRKFDISGFVKFFNGDSVSDAKVKFVSGEQVFETTTDKDGKYVFYDVPENLEGKIIVDCKYLDKSYTESIDYITSEFAPKDIVITRNIDCTGSVWDIDGNAVNNAEVVFVSDAQSVKTYTNEDGQYTFELFENTKGTLTASKAIDDDIKTDSLLYVVLADCPTHSILQLTKKQDLLTFSTIDNVTSAVIPEYIDNQEFINYRIIDDNTIGDWDRLHTDSKITLKGSQKIQLQGLLDHAAIVKQGIVHFRTDHTLDGFLCASGSIMSLVDGAGDSLNISSPCMFQSMFENCDRLKKVSDILPATTLAHSCYKNMFKGCSALTDIPTLSSTNLDNNCYESMFEGCTSLITPMPMLDSEATKNSCYKNMFKGCSALTSCPVIKTNLTTMADNSCEAMFENCTSLDYVCSVMSTNALILNEFSFKDMYKGCSSIKGIPASLINIDIANTSSCESMFEGCTSLTTPMPELHAYKAADFCYKNMFKGCSSITKGIKITSTSLGNNSCESMFEDCINLSNYDWDLPAVSIGIGCYKNMFKGCSSLDTFSFISSRVLPENCCESMYENSGVHYKDCLLFPKNSLYGKYCCKRMFANCINLEKFDIQGDDDYCANEGSFYEMFENCGFVKTPKLEAISKYNTIRSMYGMFKNCKKLVEIDGNLSPANATDCYTSMFEGCSELCIYFGNSNYPTTRFFTCNNPSYCNDMFKDTGGIIQSMSDELKDCSLGYFLKKNAQYTRLSGDIDFNDHGTTFRWMEKTDIIYYDNEGHQYTCSNGHVIWNSREEKGWYYFDGVLVGTNAKIYMGAHAYIWTIVGSTPAYYDSRLRIRYISKDETWGDITLHWHHDE